VALAAAVILIVFNISMFTVPAVKQVALDFMTKAEKTHTVINKEDGERNTVENATNYEKYRVKMEEEYQITYLPEGFYAAKEERMLQKISMDYKNINDENKMICFSQNKENTTVNADTENAVVDYVDINGEKALLAQKNDVINITWKIGKYFISITSQEIDRDELIKVAKSVKKVK
jgi:hypothetical protein